MLRGDGAHDLVPVQRSFGPRFEGSVVVTLIELFGLSYLSWLKAHSRHKAIKPSHHYLARRKS